MRYQGKLIHWDDEKGYGFIQCYQLSDNVFVHVKTFFNRERRPNLGDSVSFSIQHDKQNRIRAAHVKFADDSYLSRQHYRAGTLFYLVSSIFILTLMISVLLKKAFMLEVLYYVAIGIISFGIYAWDKQAAKQDSWRISENMLHILALLGGWIGAGLAQQWLHHKSRKQRFQLVFWLTILVNISVLAMLHLHPYGITMLTWLQSI